MYQPKEFHPVSSTHSCFMSSSSFCPELGEIISTTAYGDTFTPSTRVSEFGTKSFVIVLAASRQTDMSCDLRLSFWYWTLAFRHTVWSLFITWAARRWVTSWCLKDAGPNYLKWPLAISTRQDCCAAWLLMMSNSSPSGVFDVTTDSTADFNTSSCTSPETSEQYNEVVNTDPGIRTRLKELIERCMVASCKNVTPHRLFRTYCRTRCYLDDSESQASWSKVVLVGMLLRLLQRRLLQWYNE